MWLDPSENYDFTFDGYSQAQADARFVRKKKVKVFQQMIIRMQIKLK